MPVSPLPLLHFAWPHLSLPPSGLNTGDLLMVSAPLEGKLRVAACPLPWMQAQPREGLDNERANGLGGAVPGLDSSISCFFEPRCPHL